MKSVMNGVVIMIKINNKNLCESCFAELPSDATVCSACTFEKNNSKYPTALPEGTILAGRYVVGRVLGKGGFGITYLCYDTRENKTVAVKEYLPDHLTHRNTGETIVSTFSGETEEYFKTGAQKFFEEAKLVSNFNGNPNIISVYEFFYENNTTYFVMEYLDGVDLKTYIKEKGGTITEEEVLSIADKIIKALMIVHSTDILHRDISPDNIFMCNDGNVKLIDFGAARQVMGEVSKSLSVVLKEGFAPIEQYQTRGKQGPWTDIYALGATLYYALTGEILDNAMTRMTEDSQLNLQNVSPEIASVITKMLEIRKEDRYQDTIELRKALEPKEKIEKSDKDSGVSIKKFFDSTLKKTNFDIKNKRHLITLGASIAAVFVVVIVSVIIGASSENENKSPVNENHGGYVEQQSGSSGLEMITGNNGLDLGNIESAMLGSMARKTIAVGEFTSIGLKSDGTVVARGSHYDGQCNVEGWEDIVDIDAGYEHTVGLKSDGTVVATGNNVDGQCNVSEWTDIIAVFASNNHTIGLKSDGTVVATGDNSEGQCDVSGWRYIVDIDTSSNHTVGIQSDGTVVATGYNGFEECNVSGWTDVIDVATYAFITIGLKTDGTVVATGRYYKDGVYDVSDWKNIVAISVGDGYTVGVKSDGTVLVEGKTYKVSPDDFSEWKNIVDISAGTRHTLGLKSDGTVVAVGYNEQKQCDLSGWKNIRQPGD